MTIQERTPNPPARGARIWLLPITVVAIWLAVLLSAAPGASSGEDTPVETRPVALVSEAVSTLPEPQFATPTNEENVHEDNHPPTF